MAPSSDPYSWSYIFEGGLLNARCKVKVHPYCACDRDDEVDGHWCDEGCLCEVLADLRAKVEGMRDEAKADPVGSAVWRTTAYESVLALIEEKEAGNG